MSISGDFDEYDIFGRRVSNSTLGRWLARVLHQKNSCVGDSPKIAGMLDLLVTKGSWATSVRLAYQRIIAKGVADAANGDALLSECSVNTSPSLDWCQKLGSHFEAVWKTVLKNQRTQIPRDTSVGVEACNDFELDSTLKDSFIQLAGVNILEWDGTDELEYPRREDFINSVVEQFLRADLFAAVTELISNAHGSFGIHAISASDVRTVCIGAKGQVSFQF